MTRSGILFKLIGIVKNYWIYAAGVVVVLVLVGGYLGRQQIKALLGMGTPASAPTVETGQPAPQETPVTPTNGAPTDNIYKTMTNPAKGNYLTDFAGMTVYVFDKDKAGVSNCIGSCATLWPPYTSGATAETNLPVNISVITRLDGSKQFAWKEMPLYYYSKDLKSGDVLGDGVGGVWHLVKP